MVFEVNGGEKDNGYLAIDDIRFEDTDECSVVPEYAQEWKKRTHYR